MTSTLLQTCPLCKREECCNSEPINEFHSQYTCLSCGFETNDLMREGEFNFEAYESDDSFPLLYRDIKQTDEEGRVWYPMTINTQGKGTVYAFGKSAEDWRWRATKSIRLTEEERSQPKFKGQTHRSDPTTTQDFGRDFFGAVEYTGIF